MSLDDNEQVHFTFEADSEKTFSWCRTYCSWELITWNEKGWSYTYVNTFLTSFKLDSGPSLKGRYLPLQLSPAILSCLAIELFRGSYSPCLISRGGGGGCYLWKGLTLVFSTQFLSPLPKGGPICSFGDIWHKVQITYAGFWTLCFMLPFEEMILQVLTLLIVL